MSPGRFWVVSNMLTIEPEFCGKGIPDKIYYSVFMELSGSQRPPCALWQSPVYPFQKHRQLGGRQAHFAMRRGRPDKPSPFQTLGEETGSLTIPPDHLDPIASATAKDKQMTAIRILPQNLLAQPDALCRLVRGLRS